jgi:hypothetical protein
MYFIVNKEISKKRYEICQRCEKFSKKTKLCNLCRCFMPGKVKISLSSCPLNKWQEDVEIKE